jgi:hypothetical protein
LPWNAVVDERNDPPVWQPASAVSMPTAECNVIGGDFSEVPELNDILPKIAACANYPVRQRYQLALFGEKTSLRPVLAPLAVEFGAHLLLPSGDPSLTMLRDLAELAVADGRELIVVTLSDFDPTGFGMVASVARHLQAHRLLLKSDIRIRVIRAALNIEHVDAFGLPEAPLKETEKRAGRWKDVVGRGQVEIDALAALRRDDLTAIVRAIVAPFFDATLATRCSQAEVEWGREANARIAAALDGQAGRKEHLDRARDARERISGFSAELREALEMLAAIAQKAADQIQLPELPPVEWQQPAAPESEALFDSWDSFIVNTLRLRAAKLKAD